MQDSRRPNCMFQPQKYAVFCQIRSYYMLIIKAEACVATIAISLITKSAGQISRPDTVPVAIMWGNDTATREQMKTHPKKPTCIILWPAALTQRVIVNRSCGAVLVSDSASFCISSLSSNKAGSKLQLFKELLFTWKGHTSLCRNSAELISSNCNDI